MTDREEMNQEHVEAYRRGYREAADKMEDVIQHLAHEDPGYSKGVITCTVWTLAMIAESLYGQGSSVIEIAAEGMKYGSKVPAHELIEVEEEE